MQNLKYLIETDSTNGNSAEIWISKQIPNVHKEEKMFQRLLNEKRDLQKKKCIIENRLFEIQTELNVRREKIRSGIL